MGNKLVTALLATCTALAAQASFAGTISQADKDDWYINFSASTPNFESQDLNQTQLNNNQDSDFTASLGYRPDDVEYNILGNIRLEAEFSSSEVASTSSVMVNALYDMESEGGFTPYIGFGAGIATSNNDGQYGLSERISELHSLPAYQAIAGVSYTSESYPSAIMHMGYQYFATIGKTTANPIQEPGKTNFSTQNVEAGMRFSF